MRTKLEKKKIFDNCITQHISKHVLHLYIAYLIRIE